MIPARGRRFFSAEQLDIMDAVAARVRDTMQALDRERQSFGLIYGDFIHKNYFFQNGRVCAVDFEYCGFGYYLYDLAPVLLGWSPLANYEALKAALWAGYTALRPLPEWDHEHLETFVAARHVASCRWIASNLDNPKIRERATEILAVRSEELLSFLETGRLERRSDIF